MNKIDNQKPFGQKTSELNANTYWRTNLRYLASLLALWFIVSYGCGILFVEALNRIRIGGFYLGFWFAQQGAIYVFVVLIFVYVQLMKRLDKTHGLDEQEKQGDDKL